MAERSDAEAIRRIYNLEVTTSEVTFDLVAWTLEEQQEWIDAHSGAHPAVVAVGEPSDGPPGLAGSVLGFGSLSPYRPRPAYATTVENSVYADRDQRGRGVGRLLLEDLVRRATEHGFHAIIARIVGENEASIALHRSCGFELVGVEREVGRKHRKWLDVVELQLLL